MSEFKLTELEEALTHDYIDWEYINHDEHGFSRTIRFSLHGLGYRIIWFRNHSRLINGNMDVMFTRAAQSGTWPNLAKLNLQFYLGDETCAVLPLEYYEKALTPKATQ